MDKDGGEKTQGTKKAGVFEVDPTREKWTADDWNGFYSFPTPLPLPLYGDEVTMSSLSISPSLCSCGAYLFRLSARGHD